MRTPTVPKAVEGFLLARSADGLSPRTLRDYEVHLRRFADHSTKRQVHKITSRDINQFFHWYRDFKIERRGNQLIEPRQMSAKTYRNAWAAISSFWGWASDEFSFSNPFRVKAPKASTRAIEPLFQDEVKIILRSTGCPRDTAIFLTLLDSGCRASELCAVDYDDVDLKTGAMLLRRTKGGIPRTVYVGKKTQKSIWKYRSTLDDEAPLFLSKRGGRMNRHSLRLCLARMGDKAKVKGLHPHKLRHTFSVEFLRNGGNVFVLQRLLGHQDIATTRKYLRLVEADLVNAHKLASPVDNL